MQRILLSLAVIVAVGGAAAASTGAFFSDTEKSTGNTFTAGSLDLTVDSTAHYAGLVCNVDHHWALENQAVPTTRPDLTGQPCGGTWSQTNLGPENQFFNYSDVKPGDPGENTISLHTTNDAWVCADLKVTSNSDGAGGGSVVSSAASDFENAPYTLGNINGQNGWSKTGSYDVAVDSSLGTTGFGSQSLRISNAVTSGSFGDQTFAPALATPAGETGANNGSFGAATPENHYVSQFDIFAIPSSTGDTLSVSPDRGDGARMSYLSFSNTGSGIDVTFYDVQGTSNPANFVPTSLGTLALGVPHTIKFVMDFVNGPSNDVVKIYIDNALVHTGTSWENYYRYDPESNPTLNPNFVPTVRTMLFRASGSAVPANAGKGYLIDNLSYSSGSSLFGGALADGIQFVTWLDNSKDPGTPGDNIHQANETILSDPAALGTQGTTTIALADSLHLPALTAADPHYVGIAWCAGTMTVNQDGSFSCNGATMGNEAQNDAMTADVTLYAEQSRNNSNFTCRPN